MFKKNKTVMDRIAGAIPAKPKPSNTKRNAAIGVGSALLVGLAGAFVKNKDGGQ